MTDTEMIRPTSAPRPPYQQQQQPPNPSVRPNLNQTGVRPMLPQQQQQLQPQQQNLMSGVNGQQPRPAPSPLRRIDSKGNILMNTGQPRPPGPPGPPPPMNQVNRAPLPPGAQNPGMQQRPQAPPNWSSTNPQQQARPQFQPTANNSNPQQQNPQMRPPFPRVPGQHPVTAPNQPPFRPPFPQQQQQQHQLQMQQLQQQQQQRTIPASAPKNPNISSEHVKQLPSGNSFQNNNDDDDDVVIGQAVTPQKSANKPANPMTQSQYGSLINDNSKTDAYSTRITNQKADSSDLYRVSDNVNSGGGDYRQNSVDRNLLDKEQPVNLEQLNIFGSNSISKIGITRKPYDDGLDFVNKPANLNQSTKNVPDMNADRYSAPIQQKTYTDLKKNKKGDNDSGVDESTQGNDRNGPVSPGSPLKTPTKPQSGISRPPSATPSNKSSKSRSASRSRLLMKTPEPEPVKKVPMNRIKVGNAPSPDLKAVRSKIGSLDNSAYKPGGGNVKIEHNKVQIKAAPRIEAKNDKYVSKGGDKKIVSTKLQWNAKSKIGSLENTSHKPGGGDKKIETLKPDFKDKAKPKVGSKDNVKYIPGGGDIKIQTQKLDIKAQSKIGSMDNVKHKPGGGDKKIFDDKDYLKNVEHPVALTQPSQYWKAPKITRATTIHSEMSLPAECIVLSVSMPSLNNNTSIRRPKSAGPTPALKKGHAFHPKPFRCY